MAKETIYKVYTGSAWEELTFPPSAHTHSDYVTEDQVVETVLENSENIETIDIGANNIRMVAGDETSPYIKDVIQKTVITAYNSNTDLTNPTKGGTTTKSITLTQAPIAGDIVKVYLDSTSADYAGYNSAIIQFEMFACPSKTSKIAGTGTVTLGLGSGSSQTKLASAFNSGTTTLTIGLCGLTDDMYTSASSTSVYKVEILR